MNVGQVILQDISKIEHIDKICMKNIAIFIPSLKPGGAEKQATLLATTLDKLYKVDMYLLYGADQAAPQNIAMLEASQVRVHSLTGNIVSKIFQLKRYLASNETDILFNYLTSCDVIGAIAGRMAGVRSVYGGIRNTRVEPMKLLADKIAHNFIASGTVYNCYSGAAYFASKGYNAHRNIVIPNCFQQIAEPITREDKPIKHIVTVGRFVPQKDYLTLLRTIAELKKRRVDFVMDVVGYGNEEEHIRTWIKEYKLENCTQIHIRPDNVQEIVRSADIYLSTSLYEGTSNSIMEALNWSLPIVATNVGDNDRLVIDGMNGTLCPIGDYKGLASAILPLLDNAHLRNQYGSFSNKNLRENYSMEIFKQRYIQLIENR